MENTSEDDQTPHTSDTVVLEDIASPRSIARYRGDFARLQPKNESAKLAFSALAEMQKLDPAWNPHARKYFHIDDTQSELPVWRASDSEGSSDNTKINVWTGYYRLNLDLLPKTPKVGWVFGAGRSALAKNAVDFILTLDKRKHRIHGIHGRLGHHAESLVLMLFVGQQKAVVMNGREVSDTQRQFTTLQTSLTIGLLEYQLEFTGLDERRYRNQLLNMHQRPPGSEDLAAVLEITPSETQYEYQGFLIQAPKASGAFGISASGTEIRTGKAVAVKRVKRTKASTERIASEIRIYKRLGYHRNISQMMADFYSGGDAHSTGESPIDDVYLIYYPLAKDTFYDLVISSRPDSVRLSAFRQVLEGLIHVHQHGIMHRDIKPTNLMIVSYNPLHAIIIDFGEATFETSSTDHGRGTIAYLAPEVMAIKRLESQRAYDKRVDTWALGLSGYQLFYRAACEWGAGITAEHHENILRKIEGQPKFSKVIGPMIKWNREERSSLESVLARLTQAR